MQPASPFNVTIRGLSHIDDLKRCEEVQRSVWGFSELEVLAASHLSAAVHAGGLVAGAWYEEVDRGRYKRTLCGFVYGFPTYYKNGSIGLHSHMMAVLPKYRGLGIGQRLKWFQRAWCLERGLKWVTWTFDPLQVKNAKLNLEYLGGISFEYLVNPYGVMGGDLNGELPSDRLVVYWDLLRAEVDELASGRPQPPLARPSLQDTPHVYALHADVLTPDFTDEPLLYVATPDDINALRSKNPDKALAWRLAQREVFLELFGRGYSVTRFVDGHYALTR